MYTIIILSFCTQNGPHIIRVKAPLFTCVCKAVNIHENPTAGSVVAKLRRRSQLNRDAVKRISTPTLPDHRRISGSSLSDHSCSSDSLDEVGTDQLQDIDVTEQFLFEVGGNIGEYEYYLPCSSYIIAYKYRSVD